MNELTPGKSQITRRTVISNIATQFTGSAIAQLFTTVTFILTARILGPEQYGQYAASMTLAIFCSIIFSLGLNLWLLREGGRISSQIGNLVGSVLAIKVLLGLVYLAIMIVIAGVVNSSSLPASIVGLSALIILFNNLFMTALTAFKAILWNKINSILEATLALFVLLFTIVLVTSDISEVASYLQMRAVIQFIGLIFALGLVWYLIKMKSSWKTAKIALIQSPPYAASEFLAWLYMRVDVLIIAFILNDYAVGLYAPAAGIITAMYLLPTAINFVFIPVLSNLFATNVKQAWVTAKRLVGLLMIVGIILFVAIFFGAKYLVFLLGPSFTGSQEILQILSIILLIHSISFGLAAILVANNQQTQRSIIQAITVTINIGLNIIVIRWFGIYGVAYVYVITEILLLFGYLMLVYRLQHNVELTV